MFIKKILAPTALLKKKPGKNAKSTIVTFCYIEIVCITWAPAEIYPEGGGQNQQHLAKLTIFRRAEGKIDHF